MGAARAAREEPHVAAPQRGRQPLVRLRHHRRADARRPRRRPGAAPVRADQLHRRARARPHDEPDAAARVPRRRGRSAEPRRRRLQPAGARLHAIVERAAGARVAAERARPCEPERVSRRSSTTRENDLGVGFQGAVDHRHRRVQQRRRRRVERGRRARSSSPTTSTSRSASTDARRARCSRPATTSNFDARNAAGTFTFGSLDAFAAGLPNTFTQRLGQVDTAFTQYQLGVYWQDDVRLNRSLSVSLGVRQEMQTHIDDRMNLMPRLGFTWNAVRVADGRSAAATASSTTGTTRTSTTRRCASTA